jgi:hypothetical protein
MKDIIYMVVIGILLGFNVAYFLTDCEVLAEQNDPIVSAIVQLQPRYRNDAKTARELAVAFRNAGVETNIDPLLLIAISSRESSLLPGVVGSLGEKGLMQVHGVALSARPPECDSLLESISCQVRTGARWLAWARNQCPGPTERWLSAYGRRRCPSLKTARRDPGVAVVKTRYMKIGGKQWRP